MISGIFGGLTKEHAYFGIHAKKESNPVNVFTFPKSALFVQLVLFSNILIGTL